MESGRIEAGCDEAGRGCLAGPVVAAAVILDPKKRINGLDDSKKLTEHRRKELRIEIETKALAWAVIFVGPQEIDEVNILRASLLGMHRAIAELTTIPEHLLIDGNRFIPFEGIDHSCVVKGDSKFQSIAAASILAKTHRDELMETIHFDFPEYGWDRNKGYPSKLHRDAIRLHGVCVHHRKSFRLLPDQLSLF